MNIIGINSFFEHPAAALLTDGKLLFAIEDERLTGIKHGKKYSPYKAYIPFDSFFKALEFSGITRGDIDEIAYSYSSLAHLYTCFSGRKRKLSSFREEIAAFQSARNIKHVLRGSYEIPLRYVQRLRTDQLNKPFYREWKHHLSHAASAFFCSDFNKALVVVGDGSGEYEGTSVFVGKDREQRLIARFTLPHSLGIFYSEVTPDLRYERRLLIDGRFHDMLVYLRLKKQLLNE